MPVIVVSSGEVSSGITLNKNETMEIYSSGRADGPRFEAVDG